MTTRRDPGLLLAGNPERPPGRAGGQHHGLGAVGGLADVHRLDLVAPGTPGAGEVDAARVVGDELGAEALSLLAHGVHQLRAHDAVREAGEVLHLGGGHQGAARLHTLDDHGLRLARAA